MSRGTVLALRVPDAKAAQLRVDAARWGLKTSTLLRRYLALGERAHREAQARAAAAGRTPPGRTA
ncbi:MAG: hypothetical protein ACLQD9_00680 [Thermoplasmata archaeon]